MQVGDLVGHKTKKGLGFIIEFDWHKNHHVALVHFANQNMPEWYSVETHLEPYLAGETK